MSQRKDLKKGPKTIASSQKHQPDSSTKKTAPKRQLKFPQSLQSNKKNLMAEFDRIQREPIKKEQEGQLDKMSSVVSNSVSNSQVSSELGVNYEIREEEYGFQLPRSYVIAMSGLQEVVNQKEKEVRNISKELEENKSQNQSLLDKLEKLKKQNKNNELKIIELESHVKLLKQTANQDHKTIFQAEQRRVQFQRQTAKDNHKRQQKINVQQLQIKQLKSQLEKVEAECKELKKDSKKLSELREIQEQLKGEKAARAKAEEQIQVLKEQAVILAEGKVLAEEDIRRQPLAQVIALNSLKRQASVPKVQPLDLQRLERRHQTAQKSTGNIQAILSNARNTNSVKKQPGTPLLVRERSQTTNRQKQSPELVSQYRQLMRHQKELIGLNYQLELLQKGMTGKGQVRGQLQRNYQKLRRECQQKEMVIRQLKLFLDDPIR